MVGKSSLLRTISESATFSFSDKRKTWLSTWHSWDLVAVRFNMSRVQKKRTISVSCVLSPSNSARDNESLTEQYRWVVFCLPLVLWLMSRPRPYVMTNWYSTADLNKIKILKMIVMLNFQNLPRSFVRANGLEKRCGDIVVMNEKSKSWTLALKQELCRNS